MLTAPRHVFPGRLPGACDPHAVIRMEGTQVMDNKRLAGIPGDDRVMNKGRQILGGVIVVAVLVAAILASILVSPTIINP